jgi:adenosylmethionine-8-amino-7-oxononanoate aminotransferase
MGAILYPTTNLAATEQLVINRGSGVYVFDQSGKQYLEGMSGLWCTSLGYGNQELIDAANQQMQQLSYAHMFGGKTHPVAIELADKLASMLPMKAPRIFFGNSGSDANDTQIKLLHYYYNGLGKPQKKKIISREGAYHGVSLAASSLTGLATTHAGFDVPIDALGILRVKAPHYYRSALPGETEDAFVDRLIESLQQLIAATGPEYIAAMIVEPVTGAGGVVVPPTGYLPRVQQVLQQNDIKLIDDEVICGFGRTGQDFGARSFDIEPDMMSFAKGLSSGYLPISAAAISGEMFEVIKHSSEKHGVFGHGYTYSGHPTCCAVALKTLEIYERDKIFERAAVTGSYLQKRLREFDQHPLVGEVRGIGMIGAVELVADKATGKAFTDTSVAAYAQARCQEHGLILRGMSGATIAVCPPLVTTTEQIDELIQKLSVALNETHDYVTTQGIE